MALTREENPKEPLNVKRLAIIGGSSFLKTKYMNDFQKITVSTPYGPVILHTNAARTVYYVQRHGADPSQPYSPPHSIPKKAIIYALKSEGCSHVVGFGSCGSMKFTLPIGSILVPDDYVNPWNPITFFDHSVDGHIMPGFDPQLRKNVIASLREQFPVISAGTYIQTQGPRFESVAEIRFYSTFSDIVGMTCAHEATLCKELGLPYALIAIVDNMANGFAVHLDFEEFRKGVDHNQRTSEAMLAKVLADFSPKV